MLVISTALLLATILFASLAAQPAQAHPSTFSDVTERNPAHDAIEFLATRQIFTESGQVDFRPDDPVTRGDAVKMLISWRNVPTVTTTSRFLDVELAYSPYVEAAVGASWVTGYPDDTFRPSSPLTREQMAIILVRSQGLETEAQDLDQAAITATLRTFVDASSVSPTARPYVALAVMKGYFSGDNGRLYPLNAISRAQFCLVLYRVTEEDTDSTGEATGIGTAGDTTEVNDNPTQETPYTAEELALAAFMDSYLFAPHRSPITGEMVLQNADWYGIPPLSQLVIMAAETSLGDPSLGGTLARRNNFGCLRYHGANTPWGLLSSGRIWVAGKDWYSFPSASIGMAAWGRYLKSAMDGFYLPILKTDKPNWERFAAVYYGRGVSGFTAYVNRLHAIENRFRRMAADHGLSF